MILHRRRFLQLGVLADAVWAQAPVQGAPLSMAPLPGRILVLDARGRICVIETEKAGAMRWFSTVQTKLLPGQLAAGVHNGSEHVFLMSFVSGKGFQGYIERYDGEGRPAAAPRLALPFEGASAGLIADLPRNRLIVGDTYNRRLWSLSLETGRGKVIADLKALTRVGALALDDRNQRVFVCDNAKGRVHHVDLALPAPSPRALGDDAILSSPSAIVYDVPTASLYLADEVRDAVYYRPAPPGAALYQQPWKYLAGQADKYLKSRYFGDPVCLALETPRTGRRLWVGDRQSRMVFAFAAEGKASGAVRELAMPR